MVISREHWNDFQNVAEFYGIEVDHIDLGNGSHIVQDCDIHEDIMWAICQLNSLTFSRNERPIIMVMQSGHAMQEVR